MAMLDSSKAISRLKMTPAIFRAVTGVSEEQAHTLRDGGDGWNLVEIVAHVRDIDDVFFERARNMIEQDHPTHIPVDPDVLAAERAYDSLDLATVLAEFDAARTRFVAYLEGLSAEQWARTGLHPEAGEHTVLDLALNTVLHDIVHLHQLLKAQGQA